VITMIVVLGDFQSCCEIIMSTMIVVIMIIDRVSLSLQMLTQVLNRVCHPENTFNRIIVLRLPGEFLLIFFCHRVQKL